MHQIGAAIQLRIPQKGFFTLDMAKCLLPSTTHLVLKYIYEWVVIMPSSGPRPRLCIILNSLQTFYLQTCAASMLCNAKNILLPYFKRRHIHVHQFLKYWKLYSNKTNFPVNHGQKLKVTWQVLPSFTHSFTSPVFTRT